MMLKKLLVLLGGIAMIVAAVRFDAPWWVFLPAFGVFFIGLLWIGVWEDTKGDVSGKSYRHDQAGH